MITRSVDILSVRTALTYPECQSVWGLAPSLFGTLLASCRKIVFVLCASPVPLGMKWAFICAGRNNVLGLVW